MLAHPTCVFFVSAVSAFTLSAVVLTATVHSQSSDKPRDGYIGSTVCTSCHAEIAKSYAQTPMALSSGRMDGLGFQESLAQATFAHPKSGVTYRISKEKNQTVFEFLRSNQQRQQDDLRGKRRLDYFIGSGAAGRSYISVLEGHLFQAPVSYYAQTRKWDISPGFQEYDHAHLSRPIEVRCLECHASRLQPIEGTQNRFAEPPFLEEGVSCERCHGSGSGSCVPQAESGTDGLA